ncbi:signal recognition particle receptor subunit beta [Kitasatospora herbaricolor]|nr:ATP/GTP-binding protein [Kitasatospora herbaricolor]MDQ0305779.1 signal recognition particle receptor subunit beta [Kitasatospora herbaricolor]
MHATAKILVSGPFGVGKTTLIASLSEIEPLRTEEPLTVASMAHDDLAGVETKTTTTVALDFGRLTLDNGLVLYLFGTPGQARFLPLWCDIATGATGALVLADTRRLDQSFDSIDLLEQRHIPYVVAVNTFPDSPDHHTADIRQALDLEPHTPLSLCDARDPQSSLAALIALIQYLLTRTPEVS